MPPWAQVTDLKLRLPEVEKPLQISANPTFNRKHEAAAREQCTQQPMAASKEECTAPRETVMIILSIHSLNKTDRNVSTLGWKYRESKSQAALGEPV